MRNTQRFTSVDSMRGLTIAAMLLVKYAGDSVHVFVWLEHSEWHGCIPADLAVQLRSAIPY